MATTPKQANPTLLSITFDCADARALAGFWSAALGRTLGADPSAAYATLEGDPGWTFIKVPEGKTAKNRVHVDLGVDDLAAEADRLLALGASKLGDVAEDGYRWITLADPEGNEFDLVVSE